MWSVGKRQNVNGRETRSGRKKKYADQTETENRARKESATRTIDRTELEESIFSGDIASRGDPNGIQVEESCQGG